MRAPLGALPQAPQRQSEATTEELNAASGESLAAEESEHELAQENPGAEAQAALARDSPNTDELDLVIGALQHASPRQDEVISVEPNEASVESRAAEESEQEVESENPWAEAMAAIARDNLNTDRLEPVIYDTLQFWGNGDPRQ